ncbi:Chromosome partition protein MukB, partial [Haemophilus influenzae]
RGWLHRRFSR